jgi:O-antigen/teichoic acid export membrane protein
MLQIVVMIAGFITPKIMLNIYGSEINGLVSSIVQFISYFSLVEAGIASAAIYALYKPLAEGDHKAINAIVSAAKRFYTQSGYIFVALVVGLTIIYPFLVKINSLNIFNVSLLVLILGVSGALEFFTMAKYRVLLSADQRLYVIDLATIISIILNTVIIYVLAKFKVNIVLVRAIALTSLFLRSFILFFYVRSKYKFLSYSGKIDNKLLDKRWDALYLQILGSVQVGAPILILTFLSNLKSVSIYSIYYMVIGGINGILGVFISGLSSSFGEIIAKKELNTLQRTTEEFEFYYYSILTIIYSVAMVTLMPFIKLYTKGITDANYNLPIIGFLFVLNGLLYNIKTPQGMLVISSGMFKETRKQSTIQALIIVVVGVILTPISAIMGVLIASCLSNIYRDIDLLFFIPRNLTKLPVRKTFFRHCRVFISLIIIWVPSTFINVNLQNYFEWFGFAILVGIYSVSIVTLMVLVFERQQLKNGLLRIKSLIGVR